MIPVYASFAFLTANVSILLVILALNRRASTASPRATPPPPQPPGQGCLDPADILGWEFAYARSTASEAMQDRHTLINFYLLAVGVVASGVVAVLGQGTALPKSTATVLLWLLCGIGWLYFLKIIRLRQAWHDSAQAMNRIKDFYIEQARDFEPEVLRSAFRWQTHTLPAPHKPWTLFFYSATLIGLLDTLAYVTGGALFDLQITSSFPLLVGGLLLTFGLTFFAFHVWLYFAFLRPGSLGETNRDIHGKEP